MPRAGFTASILGAAIGVTASAAAQVPAQLPSQSDISRERVPQPLPRTPDFDLRLQAPEKSAVPRAIDELEFAVQRIVVNGATRFPPTQVDAVFAPLVARKITLEELREAAARLEALYRNAGYFLSRVFVPPQQVKDGVLEIQVVEGYVSAVFVDAPDRATRERLEQVLRPLIGKRPIRLSDLESRLLVINDMPGLTATSVLRQGAELGASELILTAKPRTAAAQLTASNSASHELGPWVFGANAALARPFGRTGALDLGIAAGGGSLAEVQSASIRYAEPIGRNGLVASLGALAGRARPGGSIDALDVNSRITSLAARLRQPLLRSRANSLFLDVGVSLNRTRTEVLGERVATDRTTVAEATLLWQQVGWLAGSTIASVGVFQGLDVLGAMDRSASRPSVAGFDPGFTRLAYSLQRTQRISERVSAWSLVQGQFTRDTLLSGELVAFGGPLIGRGYDPSLIAGDRGIGGLVELRYDLPVGSSKTLGQLQLYLFADAARATRLASGTTPEQSTRLASLGIGTRFDMLGRIRADLLFADARRSVSGNTGRDPRVVLAVAFDF